MKPILPLFIFVLFILSGCQSIPPAKMVLLDESIAEVNIAHSTGFGEMNEDIFLNFKDNRTVSFFKKAITTSTLYRGTIDTRPEYDLMVTYTRLLPAHGMHLWLGEENEPSTFMFLGDELNSTVYHTTTAVTKELRALILKEE